MLPTIFWVLAPLVFHALYLALQSLRGKTVTRFGLNVQLSLLLMLYLLATAGLGLFWVANQQLPVFDIHYLFGYATLLLLILHLYFNLPLVWRYWRHPTPRRATTVVTAAVTAAVSASPSAQRRLAILTGALAFLGLGWWQGSRRNGDLAVGWQVQSNSSAVRFIERYHEFSSESRSSVFARASAINWGKPLAEFKTYPAAPKTALHKSTHQVSSLHAALRGSGSRSSALDRADLGQILFLAAGITARRNGYALRAAPSSGALFPAEVYVAVREVQDVPSGLYHYDPQQEQLSRLADTPALAGAPQAQAADLLLIVSAVLRRTGYKYGDRAYRYASADVGHLLENLRLGAHNVGMRAQALLQFDETAIAQALGLDPVEENVLAMLALSRTRIATDAAPPSTPLLPPAWQTLPNTVKLDGAGGGAPMGVSSLVHQATSLHLPVNPSTAAPLVLALPAAQAAKMRVFDVINQRRSQRRFSEQAVPLASLAAMLDDIARAPQLSDAIGINLVVNRVSGLAAGIYRYLPQQGLLQVRSGQYANAAQQAALAQEVIGDAAVVLILSVQRKAMFAHGARGYRHAFLEAGMIGERWLLSAVARGLAACPVGAFYDDEAASLINLNPAQDWVLHFAALGVAAK